VLIKLLLHLNSGSAEKNLGSIGEVGFN